MTGFSVATKNEMLDSKTFDRVRLHSGAPGADGSANQISDTLVAAVFNAASGGERLLNADIAYTGLTPSQSVTHFSAWEWNAGDPIYRGSSALTGDNSVNAAGEFTLKGTTTKLAITDV
jgi:hypothetical protein